MQHGRFITLEGGEGAGKTTQISRLANRLKGQGIPVKTTREPGGSKNALEIREMVVNGDTNRWDAQSEALLMYAARRDHVEKFIRPSLEQGNWVLCDRFSDSTMAYQGYAGSLGQYWIKTLDRLVLGEFKPDKTLLLDLSPQAGLKRAENRGGPDRFERKGLSFHQKLQSAFLEIAHNNPNRISVINADQSLDAVEQDIYAALQIAFPELEG